MTRRYPTAAAELAAYLANSPDTGIGDASGLNVGAPAEMASAGTATLAAQSIVLPVPPSSNRYWRNYNGVTVVSDEAQNYKAGVKWTAMREHLTPFAGDVAVYMHIYRPAKRGDLDNYAKVLLDALNGIAYGDDSQVVELHSWRHDDKANPRVEVEVRRVTA